MNPKEFNRIMSVEASAAQHIPISHLNSPVCFETMDFACGMVLKMDGIAFEMENDTALHSALNEWQRCILQSDGELALTVTLHRRCVPLISTQSELKGFAADVDKAYEQRFQHTYFNDIYLTILHRAMNKSPSSIFQVFKKQSKRKTETEARMKARGEQIERLEKWVSFFKGSMIHAGVRRLGENDKIGERSELLDFFALIINTSHQVKMASPTFLPAYAKTGRESRKNQAIDGHLSQYLLHHRLYFGEAIQIQQNILSENRYGSILSIKTYPQASNAFFYQALLKLKGECFATFQFLPIEKQKAIHFIERQKNKLVNANDRAQSEIAQLESATDLIASSDLMMGYYHHSLLLIAPTLTSLTTLMTQAEQAYAEGGAIAVRETLGLEAAFWARIPGNERYIARMVLIHSRHFSDFCPLFNYPQGLFNQNHLGKALCLMMTRAQTPYYFNLHLPQMGEQPSLGHSIVIGGSGTGKTAFLTFLDLELKRYGGRSILFDRDQAMKRYVKASCGDYYCLNADTPDVSLNPFYCDDSQKNREFCLEWLCELIRFPEEKYLHPDLVLPLREAVDYAFDKLGVFDRQLRHILSILPANYARKQAFDKWLDKRGLIDNEKSVFQLADITGIDLSYYFDHASSDMITPILLYFFYRIESCLDGRLTTIILDEGWQCLNQSYWQDKLAQWLATFRKKNCHIVIATQSAETIIDSAIAPIILNNMATQIYFANPSANVMTYQEKLQLSEKEFLFIRNTSPAERLILVKQLNHSCICHIDLSDLKAYLPILSSLPEGK